jgi:hypothetical protein
MLSLSLSILRVSVAKLTVTAAWNSDVDRTENNEENNGYLAVFPGGEILAGDYNFIDTNVPVCEFDESSLPLV